MVLLLAAGCSLSAGTPPIDPEPIALRTVAEGLTQPVVLACPGDGSGRLFVVEQVGWIHVLQDGQLQPEPWADLRSRLVALDADYDERGLLGLAFHPAFADNGRVFVYYSAPPRAGAPDGYDHTQVLSELRVGQDGRLDPASERELLAVPWPYANHNGGTIAFGPDGHLYVSLGDGGNRNDIGRGHPPLGNGQDVTTLLGSILRLDVDTEGEPYGIPADNPFAGDPDGRGEIYAYGFRNPYRFSFDRQTGRLFAGDVGQDLVEEIDLVRRGGNYGWNIKEGTLCFDPDDASNPPATCAGEGARGEPLVDPILTYDEPERIATVGGHVYRGSAIRGLQGALVYGDWTGEVLLGTEEPGGTWRSEPLDLEGGRYLLAIGEDCAGELYLLTTEATGPSGATGAIQMLVPAGD